MTKHRSREDCAIDVWVALESARENGRSLVDLIATTGLTRAQVKSGLAEINHVKQLADEQPIMVNPMTWAYVLPEYYRDLMPWTRNRINDLLTRLKAEQTRIEAADVKWPDEVTRGLKKLINRLVEDMSEALVLVNGG